MIGLGQNPQKPANPQIIIRNSGNSKKNSENSESSEQIPKSPNKKMPFIMRQKSLVPIKANKTEWAFKRSIWCNNPSVEMCHLVIHKLWKQTTEWGALCRSPFAWCSDKYCSPVESKHIKGIHTLYWSILSTAKKVHMLSSTRTARCGSILLERGSGFHGLVSG